MIEVEKKFQPTEEQLAAFLKDAEFLGGKEYTDTYYDLPDFSFFKSERRLRRRNNDYELKIQISNSKDNKAVYNEEITEPEKILERMGFDKNDSLERITREVLIPLCVIKTKRKKYKMGEFHIDLDETDFGFNILEIELMVLDEGGAIEAERKIINLAESFGFEIKKLPGKVKECLRITRPEIYKVLHPENKPIPI